MKKGQSQAMAVIIILILLIFFILLMILLANRAKDVTIEAEWKTSCRTSVKLNSAKQGMFDFRTEEVVCPTRKEPVVIDWDLSDEEGQYKAKKEIADKLENCWDVYGQGKLDLFRSHKGRFCGICHIFNFEGKAKNQEIKQFHQFLLNENVPGKEVSYFEYLQGYKTKEAAKVLGNVDYFAVDDKPISTYAFQQYATVFFYVKGKSEIGQFKTNLLSTGLAAVLSPAGTMIPGLRGLSQWVLTKTGVVSEVEQQWASYIYFLPYDSAYLQALQCQLPVSQKTR